MWSGAARRKIAFPFSEAWVSPGGSHFSPGTSPAQHGGCGSPFPIAAGDLTAG